LLNVIVYVTMLPGETVLNDIDFAEPSSEVAAARAVWVRPNNRPTTARAAATVKPTTHWRDPRPESGFIVCSLFLKWSETLRLRQTPAIDYHI